MSEPFVGQVIPVGFNFAPEGWLPCDGSLQPINQYEALFTLIGTIYGGDGQSTFGLPDLRGRNVVGVGQAPGMQNYTEGKPGGVESVALTEAMMPSHTHSVMGSSAMGTSANPGASLILASAPAGNKVYATSGATTPLAQAAIGPAPGAGGGHENRQPFTVVNYIICWSGVFPSRP